MTMHQLYDMIGQMKGLVDTNPEQARQVLEANPQFVYALLLAGVKIATHIAVRHKAAVACSRQPSRHRGWLVGW